MSIGCVEKRKVRVTLPLRFRSPEGEVLGVICHGPANILVGLDLIDWLVNVGDSKPSEVGMGNGGMLRKWEIRCMLEV